jgi:hypothetical protein
LDFAHHDLAEPLFPILIALEEPRICIDGLDGGPDDIIRCCCALGMNLPKALDSIEHHSFRIHEGRHFLGFRVLVVRHISALPFFSFFEVRPLRWERKNRPQLTANAPW